MPRRLFCACSKCAPTLSALSDCTALSRRCRSVPVATMATAQRCHSVLVIFWSPWERRGNAVYVWQPFKASVIINIIYISHQLVYFNKHVVKFKFNQFCDCLCVNIYFMYICLTVTICIKYTFVYISGISWKMTVLEYWKNHVWQYNLWATRS